MRQEDLPKANATCVICGNRYYRCEKCIKLGSQGIYPWKLFCDTSKCYQLYSAFESYKKNVLTKEQAKEEILNLDGKAILSNDSKYKDVFNEIMKPAVKKFKPNKPIAAIQEIVNAGNPEKEKIEKAEDNI